MKRSCPDCGKTHHCFADRRTMASYIDRIMLGLYVDKGFTLEDIGEIFGVTRERIRQRIGSLPGYCSADKRRTRKRLASYADFCAAQSLVDVGISQREAADLFPGLDHRDLLPRDEEFRSKQFCGRELLGSIFFEVKLLVLADAWKNGATIRDLADIFDTSEKAAGVLIHRARHWYGVPLSYRYDLGMTAP